MYIVKAYKYTVTTDGNDLTPFVTQLQSHFENVSTLWELDATSTAEPNKAFTIKPTGDTQFQINFRLYDSNTSRMNVTLDNQSSITNAVNISDGEDSLPPTASSTAFNSTSALWWENAEWVGDVLYIIEVEDAIFILNRMSTKQCIYGMQVGKVFFPEKENDPTNGMEGFGIIGNCMGLGSPTHDSLEHVVGNAATGDWRVGKVSNAADHLTAQIYLDSGTPTNAKDYIRIGKGTTQERIVMPPMEVFTSSAELEGRRHLGVAKYIHPFPLQIQSGKVIKTPWTDQEFLFVDPQEGESNVGIAIPWEKGINS